MMWAAIAIVAVCAIALAVKACLGMSTADRAEDLARDLPDADRIWREDTAFNAINSGAPFPPRTGPGAGSPHCARSGNVLNTQSHLTETK